MRNEEVEMKEVKANEVASDDKLQGQHAARDGAILMN